MILKLFVDIQNRKLVKAMDSVTPKRIPKLFREDSVELQVSLLEPTERVVDPYSLVDITPRSLKIAIGDQTGLVALQDTWTKDTTAGAMTYSGTLTLNTVELNDIFNADPSLESITRIFEIEVENSGVFHTVYQSNVTVSQDVIKNSHVSPTNVPSVSEFANTTMVVLQDSETITRVRNGDEIKHHIKGLESANLAGNSGKVAAVKSTEDGFELVDAGGGASDINDLGDVDTATASPATGDHLEWDGSNWIPSGNAPSHDHTIAGLTDVDTSGASDGQVLKWVAASSEWQPANDETASGGSGAADFLALNDTPSSFTADKWLKVNGAGNAIEWTDEPSGGGGGASDFLSLTDTPSSFTAGKIAQVDSGGTAIEWADLPADGLPSGGTTNQILAKASGTDYDAEWINQPGSSGITSLPDQQAIELDFDVNDAFISSRSNSGAMDITTANEAVGKSVTMWLTYCGSQVFTFPSHWKWLTAIPTAAPASGEVGVLVVENIAADDGNGNPLMIATWKVEVTS